MTLPGNKSSKCGVKHSSSLLWDLRQAFPIKLKTARAFTAFRQTEEGQGAWSFCGGRRRRRGLNFLLWSGQWQEPL